MPKFIRKFLIFLIFSVILYFISYSSFNNYIFPNPSFYYLSTLVDRFDQKIQNINPNSLKLRIVNDLPKKPIKEGINDPLELHNTEEVLKNSSNDLKDEDQSEGEPVDDPDHTQEVLGDYTHDNQSHGTKDPHYLEGDATQPFVVNTYFIYLLRILSRFLFLIFVQLYVFYILLFRYGELFKDLCDLSIKSMKDFNWKSPINFMKSFYCFVTWLLSIFMYYNSQLSVRHKLIAYSLVVLVLSMLLFRVGLGTRNLINTTSLFIGLAVYLSVLFTFNSRVPDGLVLVDRWFIYIWSATILLRGFKLDAIDGLNYLTERYTGYRGSHTEGYEGDHAQMGVNGSRSVMENICVDNTVNRNDPNLAHHGYDGSRFGYTSSQLGYNMVKLTHEASCALDLHLILLMLNLIKSVPFLGRLFLKNVYLSHMSLMFNLAMMVHCFMVYASPTSSLSAHITRAGDGSSVSFSGLDSTPLSKIRQLVLYILNYIVLYLFGVPNYFSSKSTSLNLFLQHFGKFKHLFKVVFGRFLEPLYERPSFLFVVKCLESIPQLLLLLLPPLFSRVYFEYSTLLVPITTFLSHNGNFKERAFCLIIFALSNLVRNICNLMYWFTFKTIMRIVLIFTLNYVMVLVKRFIKLSE